MFSCEHGHESVVETLLNGGATVDMQEKVLVYWIVYFVSLFLESSCNHHTIHPVNVHCITY